MASKAEKITAQIACEYIGNHPDAGWLSQDLRDVFTVAIDTGVADLYVDSVSEAIQFRAMAVDAEQ